jgi:hypothetical protein
MKRSLIILSFLLFSIAQANCQKEKNIRITEPEFSSTAVFVNDTMGSGILLEQQTATLEKGIVAIKYVVKVSCSTVFADTINSQFIVRIPDNSLSPYDEIRIIKLKIENSRRTWNYSKPETIEFKAKKYGTSSYLITVPKFTLGQYAILFKNNNTVNLFGVKPIKGNF